VSKIYTQISLLFAFVTILLIVSCSCSKDSDKEDVKVDPIQYSISIPMGGNSWIVNDASLNKSMITDDGVKNWSDEKAVIRTWFRLEKEGTLQIGVKARQSSGESTVRFSFGSESSEVKLNAPSFSTIDVGTYSIEEPGYYYIDVKGLDKSGNNFGELSHILLGGDVTNSDVFYVKDDFYWGRRGPSVHLGYQVPENIGDVQWFYNEITVPEGEDVVGSYFMANGFGEGYFGIQVNSSTERRILFSVWSPYQTDDPNSIPDEDKIKLLKKGEGVNTGEFGNEGSGGQSYKIYNWKAGSTYKFLLKGHPSENNSTDYTAYFYAPEKDKWELIASFRRPKTTTYITRPHSFLENFITEMGTISRKAYYTNQWVVDKDENWYELTGVKFTADATARKDARRDYAGGVENGKFYLKNCGFFNERVPYDTEYTREKIQTQPIINFSTLP